MATPFLGEIWMAGFNFAPKGFALCDGQLLPISQNTALFSLLGTSFGGDGKSTFALPNLQGSVPIGAHQGPGLSDRVLGETGGETAVALLSTEMPSHVHNLAVSTADADRSNATGNFFGVPADPLYAQQAGQIPGATLGTSPVVGGSQPHNNLSPYLVLTFIIALQGIFPARN